MYSIEKTPFGFKLTHRGNSSEATTRKWIADVESLLEQHEGDFNVLVDMRAFIPVNREAFTAAQRGIQLAMKKGMKRVMVVTANPALSFQMKRLLGEAGGFEMSRFIDAKTSDDWAQKSIEWLANGVDPDKRTASLRAG